MDPSQNAYDLVIFNTKTHTSGTVGFILIFLNHLDKFSYYIFIRLISVGKMTKEYPQGDGNVLPLPSMTQL